MKLIIDVPEYAYKHIREYYEKNDIVESTYSYIYHGTPIPDNATVCDIEQIRNEVQRMADSKILNMKIVLELIDKYTKGDTDV